VTGRKDRAAMLTEASLLLGHHAHILTTRGESYRTRKRRRKEEAQVAP
jgi:hypothetical protein